MLLMRTRKVKLQVRGIDVWMPAGTMTLLTRFVLGTNRVWQIKRLTN